MAVNNVQAQAKYKRSVDLKRSFLSVIPPDKLLILS